MSLSKNSKMLQFINYRMRIVMDDGRTLVGRFLAFDKHMNVVLAECEEFRRAKKSDKEERRALGLTLLRGECLVSIAVESAPSAKKKRNAEAAGLSTTDGPSGGAGRGASAPPPGLAGPAPGLGGSGAAAAAVGLSTLQPQLAGDARMYPTYGRGANAQPPPPPPYGRGVPPVPVNMHHRPPHMMPALNAAPIAPFAQDTQRAPPPSQPYGGGTPGPGGYGRGGPPPSG